MKVCALRGLKILSVALGCCLPENTSSFMVSFFAGWLPSTGWEISLRRGVYLVSINLPLPTRSSPNAVRVLALAPHGASGHTLRRKLLEDVRYGATTGIVDYDAAGERRRAFFLDLLGIVGDSPSISQYVDILGRTESACCHLCRFIRGSGTILGSIYSSGICHGMQSYSSRALFQHTTIRDCGAPKETLRLDRMKSAVSHSSTALPQFSTELFNAKESIRRTAEVVSVVSHFFDP